MSQASVATEMDISNLPTADGDASLGGEPQQEASDSSLSTGAKVGLGVGIPLGIMSLAAIGALLWLRRRRQSGGSKETSGSSVLGTHHKETMPPYQETALNHQGAAVYRHEAPSPPTAAELPAAVEPSELPPQTKPVR